MSSVFTSTVANTLKKTLKTIVDDDTDGVEGKADFPDWCEIKTQEDNYEDDLELGGPGVAPEKSEGSEIATGTLREGALTRYLTRTFGLKLIVSEEAMEDTKYPQSIIAARRIKRALWKTADIDATFLLARMANASYTGGDGQPLSSASHTLPNGGTFSNQMATPFSPSVTALSIVRANLRKMVGHDGLIEGYEMERILCPVEQETVWQEILGSDKRPENGNFSTMNAFYKNRSSLEVKPLKFWSNTTTNWVVQTDAENGLQFRWRRRPESRTWVDNGHTMMCYAMTARWSRGWSDPRSTYCVNA